MRAVRRSRYGSPDVLVVEEIDRPRPVGHEVVVEVEAASINTADLDHLYGRPLPARLGTGLLRPRHRGVGLDVAGRVTEVGPDVRRLRPGDEVWADLFTFGHGAFAEAVCAPEAAFSLKPAGVGFAEAATVPHSGLLAWQALAARGPVRAGEEVLVNGAGGCVGPFAVQIAKANGAVVTGVDRGEKLDFVAKAGADRTIDYRRENIASHRHRYDLVIDIAGSHSLFTFRRMLKPGGRYVLIASTLRRFMAAALAGATISAVGDRRMGVFMWTPNRHPDLLALGQMVESGLVAPVVDELLPLEDTPRAMHRLEEGRARGKLVITP